MMENQQHSQVMNELEIVSPSLAWKEVQQSIAKRLLPAKIADYIANTAPWARSQQFVSILKREANLIPGISILDAGCATGQLGLAAAIYCGAEATLLDYSEEAIDFAKSVAEELVDRGHKFRCKFIIDNLEHLQLDEQFDIVTNQGVIEHWFEEDARLMILSQMKKVAKPGGMIIVWVPNSSNFIYRRWIKKNTEVAEKAFSLEELNQLFNKAGLKDVKVFPVTAYKTFTQYTLLRKFKKICGLLWLLEIITPHIIKDKYLRYFGYELVAVGRK